MKRFVRRVFGEAFKGTSQSPDRLYPTLALVFVVLLATWMGDANGGYFAVGWAPAALTLGFFALVIAVVGPPGLARPSWETLTLGLLSAYTAWTFASLLWSPNVGDAWAGAAQTLLYLLAFFVVVALVTMGASRRWVLAASVLGPALVAAFTLGALDSWVGALFENGRLVGTVGYYNGEAAFLLLPFWVAVYLGGCRRVNLALRGVALAGIVLCVDVAVLTQSRGAMLAMAASVPVYFLLSGLRLRGVLALVPVALSLYLMFPGLNEVYLADVEGANQAVALDQVLPGVWLTAAGAGAYGVLWGLLDRRWRPSTRLVRVVGVAALAGSLLIAVVGMTSLEERFGDPREVTQQKWQAFKNDDRSGQEQSRYLSASGSGRYTLWQVAWADFTEHPVLGVGTHNYEATYYQLREQPIGYVRQPHMLPLEVLAERGLVGGVLFFGFLFACALAALWERFTKLSSDGKAQVGALGAAVAYWLVHSSVEWFWQLPAVTLPAIVYLALLVSPWRGDQDAASVPRRAGFRWPLRMVGISVAVLAFVVFVPLYAADLYLSQSFAAADPKQALVAMERAERFNPANARLYQREAHLAAKTGDWSRVEASYAEAIQLNPQHYAPYALFAAYYERRGDLREAESYYRKARALNPLDWRLRRDLKQIEEARTG